MSIIHVNTGIHFINGIRNQHCCNVDPYGGCCKYMSAWQEGGGWSERTFIYCEALHRKIFMEPSIPKPEEKPIILLPVDCPVRFPKGQISLIDILTCKQEGL